jgi:dihydroorotase/N-acyl-D-amino-acid deacylase
LNLNVRVNENVMSVLLLSLALALYFVAQLAGGSKLPCFSDSEGTAPEGLLGKEFPHPRAYGTFPHVLHKYVHEERRMSREEAIRKFTSLPASRLRLNDRGVLKVGIWADIVVFDPDQIMDKATFSSPKQLSVGMQWVLVNGVPVIADGVSTKELPGRVLREQGYFATR